MPKNETETKIDDAKVGKVDRTDPVRDEIPAEEEFELPNPFEEKDESGIEDDEVVTEDDKAKSDPAKIEAEEYEKFIYVGKKKLKSHEELIEYVKELEGGSKDNEPFLEPEGKSVSEDTEKPKSAKEAKDEILTQMLIDPEAFVEKLTSKVVANVRKSDEDSKQASDRWDRFYSENKDLSGHRELVQLVMDKHKNEYLSAKKDPGAEAGLKRLAEETRKLMTKIQSSDSEVETVDTGKKPTVVSSSGSPAPKTVTKPVERKGFLAQVKAHQESKRLKTG